MTPTFTTKPLVPYSVKQFKTGEIQVTLESFFIPTPDAVTITGSITSSDQLMELCQLVDTLRHYLKPQVSISLVLAYCPYSRQDRRCNLGESFSLKVFTDIINSLGFSEIKLLDPHSYVSPALLNASIVDVADLGIFSSIPHDLFVAPDAGAAKKVAKCSTKFNTSMFTAEKVRASDNSSVVTSISVDSSELDGKSILIIDDICDGGRTFIELCKAIKARQPNCTVNLYVTHGFFTYGIDCLLDAGISNIYTTNSVCNISHPNLTIYKVI